MRIFKQKANGKPYKKWTVEFVDHLGSRRKLQAFTDKGATATLGHKLEKLVSYRTARRTLDAELTEWIEGLLPRMVKRLSAIGIIDAETTAAIKPLMVATRRRVKQANHETFDVTGGHLADYRQHLEAKERSVQHIRETISHCARLMDANRWTSPSDIDSTGVEAYVASQRDGGISARTSNATLTAFKGFCNWMKRQRRIVENPVSRVSKLNERADRRHVRRVLTTEQVRRLLVATEAGEVHHGMTGHERALVYRLALETGLRHGEIRKLHRVDFDLTCEPASVHIRAEDEKAGRGDVLPLRPKLAHDFEAYFNARLAMPGALAFPAMGTRGAQMLRTDLDAAAVDWREDDNRTILDFHSLRHTFGTMLAAAGVHPKTAMDLMRHSDINLTMRLYSHTLIGDRAKATAALPDFTEREKEVKTGTADVPSGIIRGEFEKTASGQGEK